MSHWAARVAVRPPGAAHVVLALDQDEVVDAVLLQADRHAEPAEAGAHDDHVVNVRAFHGVHGIQSNVEIVRRLFERFAEGGIEAALDGMDEELVIEIPPRACPPSRTPTTGTTGARRYFAGFDGMLEDVRYEAIELIPVGERVIAHARMGGRGVSSGLDVDIEAFVVHELAGGKVTRMRPYRGPWSPRRRRRGLALRPPALLHLGVLVVGVGSAEGDVSPRRPGRPPVPRQASGGDPHRVPLARLPSISSPTATRALPETIT